MLDEEYIRQLVALVKETAEASTLQARNAEELKLINEEVLARLEVIQEKLALIAGDTKNIAGLKHTPCAEELCSKHARELQAITEITVNEELNIVNLLRSIKKMLYFIKILFWIIGSVLALKGGWMLVESYFKSKGAAA